MRRTIYTEEHEDFRAGFRQFLEREAVPYTEDWEDAGLVDRSFFEAAGNRSQWPPFACNSPTRRPPSVATRARAPTDARAPATSTVVRSAPPASSSGMIWRIRAPARTPTSLGKPVKPRDSAPVRGPSARTRMPPAGICQMLATIDPASPPGFTVR